MTYDDWKTHNPDDDRCEFCGAAPWECRGGWQPNSCTGECCKGWRDPDQEYEKMRDEAMTEHSPSYPETTSAPEGATHLRRPEYITAWLFDGVSVMPLWLIEKYHSQPLPEHRKGKWALAVDGEFWRWEDAERFENMFVAIDRSGGVAQAAWMPIETAPKPNVSVLIWYPWMAAPRKGAPTGFAYIARWTGTAAGEDCWRDPVDFEPMGEGATHWMPLPDDPTLSSTDRVSLPGYDETMANLNALTISSPHRAMLPGEAECDAWIDSLPDSK